ncbi:hypothetical protein HDU98_004450 [Podochytrium sp. JEL0797]|nr:hypothetical protein HDU98_004448 [Podochytrium sp. JEL0797]KAJ3072007.1 hypothetical protein HDU98_004450 [Podochytrium sp. JEL0797]
MQRDYEFAILAIQRELKHVALMPTFENKSKAIQKIAWWAMVMEEHTVDQNDEGNEATRQHFRKLARTDERILYAQDTSWAWQIEHNKTTESSNQVMMAKLAQLEAIMEDREEERRIDEWEQEEGERQAEEYENLYKQ